MGEGRVRVKQERRNLRNKKTSIDNLLFPSPLVGEGWGEGGANKGEI